jgi:hypothetical protein
VFRTVVRELVGCAILVASIAAAACTSLTGSSVASTTVTTFAPVTGIEVDANQLFESQGCGQGPSLAFKYVVVVYSAYNTPPLEGQPVTTSQDGSPSDPIAISLNDCFADAVFENLSTSAAIGGSDFFALTIDVFDDVTFAAQATTLDTTTTTEANALAISSIATWTTTCVARQQPNVQSLATCGPLVATGN